MSQQVNSAVVNYDHQACVWFLSSKRELFTSHPEEVADSDDEEPDVKLVGTVVSTAVFQNRPQGSHLLLNVQPSASGSKRVVFSLKPSNLVTSAPQGQRFFLGKTALRDLMELKVEDIRGKIHLMHLCFPPL